MGSTTLKLVFGSDVRLVDVAHAAAEKIAAIAGFGDDDALNVGIAVREAVINAIAHGNRRDPGRKVEVTLKAKARSIEARVRDQGEGFDVSAMPDPLAADNVLKTSGRGILMIRAFVDDVQFRHREGRGMEVTLVKRRSPRRAALAASSARS